MKNSKLNLLSLSLFLSLTGSPRAFLADDTLCQIVSCGHGTCRLKLDSSWGYDCKCKHGWKQYPTGLGSSTFPPCILPNCTIDYKCSVSVVASSASPWMTPALPSMPPPAEETAFCAGVVCGGGSCVRTGVTGDEFRYRCDCWPGYSNFRNLTTAACLEPCALGGDCSLPRLNNLPKNGSSGKRNICSDHLLLTTLLLIAIFLGWA